MLVFGNSYSTYSFRPSMETANMLSNLSKYRNLNVNASFESSIFNNYQSQISQNTVNERFNTVSNPSVVRKSSSNDELALELANLRKSLEDLESRVSSFKQSNSVKSSTPVQVTTSVVSNSKVTTTNSSLNDKLLAAGYDKETSEKLAQASVAQAAGRTKSTGWCARYVNNAIEAAGLVKKDSTRRESAYQLVEAYTNSGAFTQVKVSKNELKNLPAGCIIVWQPGKGFGNAFAKHGHVVITQGNNKATSDYSQEIKDYGTDFTVFVPKKK